MNVSAEECIFYRSRIDAGSLKKVAAPAIEQLMSVPETFLIVFLETILISHQVDNNLDLWR
jgi:hypothetical protein